MKQIHYGYEKKFSVKMLKQKLSFSISRNYFPSLILNFILLWHIYLRQNP
jgi:hypothetical protein